MLRDVHRTYAGGCPSVSGVVEARKRRHTLVSVSRAGNEGRHIGISQPPNRGIEILNKIRSPRNGRSQVARIARCCGCQGCVCDLAAGNYSHLLEISRRNSGRYARQLRRERGLPLNVPRRERRSQSHHNPSLAPRWRTKTALSQPAWPDVSKVSKMVHTYPCR